MAEPADPPSTSGQTRALRLLEATRDLQAGLAGPAALAWERAAFRAAFLRADPGQRIRAFLSGQRPED